MRLRIKDDDGNSQVVNLDDDETTIGRLADNTIELPDRNVSRRHARLVADNGAIFLEEVSARYGTRLNGSVLEGRTEVTPGDVIQIGDWRLAVEGESVDQPVAEALPDEDEAEEATATEVAAEADEEEKKETDYSDLPALAVGRGADGSTGMIRIDDLGDIDDATASRDIPSDQRARLVVVGNNLHGREYVLKRSPISIGRTDDADWQLEHRSVSREHALISWSNGIYTVRDVASGNGIKVNEDFYTRTDLHPGDVMELGHIRVRFVGPNETFNLDVFDAQEDEEFDDDLLVDEVKPAGVGGKLILFLVLLLMGGAVAVWILFFSGKEEPKRTGNKSAVSRAEVERDVAKDEEQRKREEERKAREERARKAEEAARKYKEEANIPPGASGDIKRARELLAQAKTKLTEGDLSEARKLVNEAGSISQGFASVSTMARRITDAGKARNLMGEIEEVKKKRRTKWEDVWDKSIEGLGLAFPGSPDAEALRAYKEEAAKKLLPGALKDGKRLMRRRKWFESRKKYREALRYDPANEEAKEALTQLEVEIDKWREKREEERQKEELKRKKRRR